MPFTPSMIPTLTTTLPLVITATQFQSFATPAITVAFPSAYGQTQIPFVFTDTASYAATRVQTTIGGVPATAGVSTAYSAGATQYGQITPPGTSTGGGTAAATTSAKSGLPLWAIATIAAAGAAGVLIFGIGLYCWCKRKKTTEKKQAARKNRGNAKTAAAFAEKHAVTAAGEDRKGPAARRNLSLAKNSRAAAGGGGGRSATYFGVAGGPSPPPDAHRGQLQQQQQQSQPPRNQSRPPNNDYPNSRSNQNVVDPYPPYPNLAAPAPVAFDDRRSDTPQRGPHVPFAEYDAYGQAIPIDHTQNGNLRRPRSYSSSLVDHSPSYAASLDGGSPAPLLKGSTSSSNDEHQPLTGGRRADQDLRLNEDWRSGQQNGRGGAAPDWPQHNRDYNRAMQDGGHPRSRSTSPFPPLQQQRGGGGVNEYERGDRFQTGGSGGGSREGAGGERLEFGRALHPSYDSSSDQNHRSASSSPTKPRPQLRSARSADPVSSSQDNYRREERERGNDGRNDYNGGGGGGRREERRRSAQPTGGGGGGAYDNRNDQQNRRFSRNPPSYDSRSQPQDYNTGQQQQRRRERSDESGQNQMRRPASRPRGAREQNSTPDEGDGLVEGYGRGW